MNGQSNISLIREHLKADKIMLFLVAIHFLSVSTISAMAYDTYVLGFVSGALLFLITLATYVLYKGQRFFRVIVGVVLMIFSAVIIQQHYGRIEFHFHIFVAISFLTIYKDYLPSIAAGATTAVYHIVFNYLQQHNIIIFDTQVYIFDYGCGWDIVFLHIFFVVVEVVIVSLFIKRDKQTFINATEATQKYQALSISLENEVQKQTADLRKVNELYEETQAITHLGNWEWDMTTDELVWNDEIYRIFNLEPQSVNATYDTFMGYVHPEDRQDIEDGIKKAIEEGAPYNMTHKLLLRDNVLKYVHEQGKVYRDENNKPIRMVGTVQDISPEMRVKNELQESEEKFRIMSEKTNTAIFIFQYTFIYSNEAMENISGYSNEELSLIHPTFIIPVDSIEQFDNNLQRRLNGEFFTEEYDSLLITTKDGEEKLISLHINTIAYKGGYAGLGTAIDVTEAKKVQEELKVLSQVIEQTDDIVKITDSKGFLTYINDAFISHTGYTRREVIGKRPNILKSGKHPDEFYEDLWDVILTGEIFRSVLINRKKDGSIFYEEQTITPIVSENGKITSFVSTGKDITERMKLEEKLKDMATIDKLTNTYNRYKFDELFNLEIERFERHQTTFSLIMLDIDHFKNINDTYGHDVGDSVLVEVATLVKTNIRKLDSLCRWGGEEFIILCPQTELQNAKRLANKLRLLVEEFEYESVESVTSSFGVTSYTNEDNHDLVLKRLDDALYRAKEQGRNCVVEL